MLWIAFKFITFDTLETAWFPQFEKKQWLWIAFKFITFDTLETAETWLDETGAGCESLSNLLPLTHWKQRTSDWGQTNQCCESLSNLLPLTHWKQRIEKIIQIVIRCESLSNLLPLTHWKQLSISRIKLLFVVNRFQIYYLWHIGNSSFMIIAYHILLWIAFKFITFDTLETAIFAKSLLLLSCESLSNLLHLTHWKQQLWPATIARSSCESLSNLLPLTHWKQPIIG